MTSLGGHVDVLSALIGLLVTVIGFFAIRTITKVDKNQTILFEQVSALWKELFLLKGEHQARHGKED